METFKPTRRGKWLSEQQMLLAWALSNGWVMPDLAEHLDVSWDTLRVQARKLRRYYGVGNTELAAAIEAERGAPLPVPDLPPPPVTA